VLLAFVAVRLGPQVGAWTGIAPGGELAPVLDLATLDGARITAEELRGSVVVVNFWATWCRPCRIEMPWLQTLHDRYADEGLVVLGLSTDAGGRGPVERLLAERGITYPVAMADRRTIQDFGGIRGIPTTFIIDRDGVIRHRVVGLFALPAMESAVRRLLHREDTPVPREPADRDAGAVDAGAADAG
jgi:cytochrome c biogenesis protein CcmG, thiol:disulfide interchange protein DsbE